MQKFQKEAGVLFSIVKESVPSRLEAGPDKSGNYKMWAGTSPAPTNECRMAGKSLGESEKSGKTLDKVGGGDI